MLINRLSNARNLRSFRRMNSWPATLSIALIAAATIVLPTDAADEKPGIKQIELVTDIQSIVPGVPFTVGFVIETLEGYHTYWRGPVIVGVATRFEWQLPAGFSAGEVAWPPPQKVNMAGYTAYGFRGKTVLLTEITPSEIIENNQVTLNLRSAWMACGSSCHPGVDDFTLTLPVNRSGIDSVKNEVISKSFELAKRSIPPSCPKSWQIGVASPSPDQIQLDLTIPGFNPEDASSIYFYSYDLQVDSNEPQIVSLTDSNTGEIRLTLVRPDEAPDSQAALAGLLYYPGGWPETGTSYVEITAPWPNNSLKNE